MVWSSLNCEAWREVVVEAVRLISWHFDDIPSGDYRALLWSMCDSRAVLRIGNGDDRLHVVIEPQHDGPVHVSTAESYICPPSDDMTARMIRITLPNFVAKNLANAVLRVVGLLARGESIKVDEVQAEVEPDEVFG